MASIEPIYRIFYSPRSDPMIFSTPDRFRILADEIDTLKKDPNLKLRFPVSTRQLDTGYERLLSAFQVSIDDSLSENGKSTITDEGVLKLAIPQNSIEALTKIVRWVDDCNHLHWYSAPISLIFEANIGQVKEFEST